MIVSSTRGLVRTVDEHGIETQWRCLARRGMLYSECEAFDYLHLAPGAVLDRHGDGIEQVWHVLSGEGELVDHRNGSPPVPLQAGDLVLCPGHGDELLRSNPSSALELLLVAVLPLGVIEQLPGRRPVA